MDLPSAETASSRRSLVSALGVAGLASVAAVAVARPVSAAPAPAPVPFSPTDRDKKLLGQALQIEFAAKLLYARRRGVRAARRCRQGRPGVRRQPRGLRRPVRGDHRDLGEHVRQEVLRGQQGQVRPGNIDEFTAAAWELENNFAATYTDLFDKLEATQTQTVISSIVVINGRMATVLADLARLSDDFDVLFEPPVEIITLPEVTA